MSERMPAPSTDLPTVSVVTCAYSDDRWDDLTAAVESVRRQTRPPLESILVIDHNERLLDRARTAFPDVRVEPNTHHRGAAGARNTAGECARGDIIAFLDDDARADDTWLEELIRPFEDPLVAGVGGRALPLWPRRRPSWFPEEFDWVVGCSYRGLPTVPTAVRNLIGTNMSVRRELMAAVGGFREGYGNVSGDGPGDVPAARLSTGEETEFCIRVGEQRPETTWIYTTSAAVWHRIPPYRTTFGYFLSRCWIEGKGKATLAGVTGPSSALASERAYAFSTLPSGVVRETAGALRGGDLAGIARAGSIVIGLGVTTVAYLVGRLRSSGPRERRHAATQPSPGAARR
jgi:glycosyltransferase involved in cell wall biosynthesis